MLKNVSFRSARGERVALVGHTGAGKTTVTALLLRFYEPQRGEILINGIDIRQYSLASLRALFAIVQQDFFLFTGDVAQNISLGDPKIARGSGARSRACACRPTASSRASRSGTQSEVRERGAGFSVGEKQLLSFARALAFNPPVLILDEATSSIDTETEVLIQEAIQHADGRAHVDRHRAPPLDDPLRRHDPRLPPRRDPRARHARGADAASTGCTGSCTRSSTASQ